MKKERRYGRGFTLIEIMIVLTIIGALLALVGPMTLNAIDKAEAKKELYAFQNWVRQVSAKSYYTGYSRTVKLDGRRISLIIQAKEAKSEVVYETTVLFFKPQTFALNQSGFSSVNTVAATLNGKEIVIDIAKLINNEYSGELIDEQ